VHILTQTSKHRHTCLCKKEKKKKRQTTQAAKRCAYKQMNTHPTHNTPPPVAYVGLRQEGASCSSVDDRWWLVEGEPEAVTHTAAPHPAHDLRVSACMQRKPCCFSSEPVSGAHTKHSCCASFGAQNAQHKMHVSTHYLSR